MEDSNCEWPSGFLTRGEGCPSIFVPTWIWCYQRPHREPESKITVICIWGAIKGIKQWFHTSLPNSWAQLRPHSSKQAAWGASDALTLAELHQGMNYWVLCRSPKLHSDRERGLGHVIEQKEIGKSGKQVSGREAIALFKQGEGRGQKGVKILTFHVLWNVHRSRQHLLLGGLKEWLEEFEWSPPQFPSLLHSEAQLHPTFPNPN